MGWGKGRVEGQGVVLTGRVKGGQGFRYEGCGKGADQLG